MSDAEKQRIIVQISAVQTELKRTMDERCVCCVELPSVEITDDSNDSIDFNISLIYLGHAVY